MASLRIVTRKEAGMHPVIFVVFSICVSHASPSLLKEEHCKLWLEVDSSALGKDAVTCILPFQCFSPVLVSIMELNRKTRVNKNASFALAAEIH